MVRNFLTLSRVNYRSPWVTKFVKRVVFVSFLLDPQRDFQVKF